MHATKVSRRRFILAALAITSTATTSRWFLSDGIAWANDGDRSALVRFARLLLPHAGLADDVYAEVVDTVFSNLATNPDTAQLLEAAGTALDAQQDSAWIDAAHDVQVTAIRNIQAEGFFAAVLATVRGTFYYHPRVWEHIDYPGSSKEHGGYLNRGFNDIDWLPEIE